MSGGDRVSHGRRCRKNVAMQRSLVTQGALAVVSFIGFAGAAAAEDLAVRSLGAGAKSPAATIGDVAFLSGDWIGAGLGACAEEIIAPAAGGQIMGMFRQMKPEGGLRFYEFYTIAEKDGSLLFRIKHFDPDMTGWEEKEKTTDFPLVGIEGKTAYFDGLTYARTGETSLLVAVNLGEGVAQFTYRKAEAGEACK